MLDKDKLKSDIKKRVYNSMKKAMQPSVSAGKGYEETANSFMMKIADAMSDMAMDIVDAITKDAEVQPGIGVSTSGGSGATTSPGKIQ